MNRSNSPSTDAGPIRLPAGWIRATVSDVTSLDIGFPFRSAEYSTDGIRLLRGDNVEPGRLRWRDAKYWPHERSGAYEHLLVTPGDIILAMDRPVVSAGLKLARATAADCPCLLVQRVARLRGRHGMSSFLSFVLSSPDFIRHVVVGGLTGTQLPHISGSRISSFAFGVPPAAEQASIVEFLEMQFSRLDASVAGLKRVQANLKRYRASVLKAAVEGRLVPTEAALAKAEGRTYEPASALLARILTTRRKRWEEAELAAMKAKGTVPKDDKWKAKYQEPIAPDTKGLPELPEGWCWARADVLCSSIDSGSTPEPEHFVPESAEAIPFLKVYNLTFDGSLDFGNNPTWVSYEHHARLRRSRVLPGDVLTNIVGPPLGKVSIVPATFREWNINQAIVRFRVSDGITSEFLAAWLQSSTCLTWLKQTAKTTTSQVNLATTTCRALPVPLPPTLEQNRTVDQLRRVLSLEGKWVEVNNTALARINRLRQAILKWAFEGKLVDQDPNDEPASVLLERIRAERQSGATAKARNGQTAGPASTDAHSPSASKRRTRRTPRSAAAPRDP